MAGRSNSCISKRTSKNPSEHVFGDIPSILRHGGRAFLLKLKQRSIRNNSWFSVLSLEKRRFIDAVIQTVEKIRSSLLLKLLTAIAEKLLNAIGGVRGLIGELPYATHIFGRPLAQKISQVAAQWGNSLASKWASDEQFIRYLAIVNINNSTSQILTSGKSKISCSSSLRSANWLKV